MATTNSQMWQGSKFKVEHVVSDAAGEVVFRFTGPFTARDMYGSLSPDAFHAILDSAAGVEGATTHVLDLSGVPYIDSAGLGLVVAHFSKCQKAGIRMSVVGAGKHVLDQFQLTKMDTLFPVSAALRSPADGVEAAS